MQDGTVGLAAASIRGGKYGAAIKRRFLKTIAGLTDSGQLIAFSLGARVGLNLNQRAILSALLLRSTSGQGTGETRIACRLTAGDRRPVAERG